MALFTKEEYNVYHNEISEIVSLNRTIRNLQERLDRIDLGALRAAEDIAIQAFSNAESAFVRADRKLEHLRNTNAAAQTIRRAETSLEQARASYESARIEMERATNRYNRAESRQSNLSGEKASNESRINSSLNNLRNISNNPSLNIQDIVDDNNTRQAANSQQELRNANAQNIVSKMAAVETILLSANHAAKEYYQASIDVQLKQIETMTKVQSEIIKTGGKSISNAINSALKVYSGVIEGAYAAAQASVDTGVAFESMAMSRAEAELSQKNFEEVREAQAIASIGKDFATAAGAAIGLTAAGPIGAAVGAGIGQLVGVVGDWMVSVKENEAKLSEAQMKFAHDIKRATLEEAESLTRSIREFANQRESSVEKQQDNAVGAMAALGVSTRDRETYEKHFFSTQTRLGYTTSDGKFHHYDKDGDDMAKWQTAYVENTGRNYAVGQKGYNNIAALGTIIGDDNAAVSLVSGMDIFNHSVSSSTNLFYKMYQMANKAGISNRKYAKELLKNLQLAEKIQFKDGVRGMMEMSIWAQQTRFNMDSLGGMIEDMHSGGFENAITKAAGMQVLGGQFALGANPLAMLWESYMSPQDYAKRMQDMTKGIGTYNSKTGDVEYGINDQVRLEQFAKYSGQNIEDVKNQIRQRARGEKVSKQLSKDVKWDKSEKALVTSKAQVVDGEWVVTMNNGEQKAVNDLTKDDVLSLMPIEERIEDHVSKIMSYTRQMAGVTKEGNAKIEESIRAKAETEWEARMEENKRFFEDKTGALKAQVETQMEFATQQNKLQHTIMENTTGILQEYNMAIAAVTDELMKKIKETGENTLRNNLRAIATGMSTEGINVINGNADKETYRRVQQDPKKREGLTDKQKEQVYNQDTRSVGQKILDFFSGMKSSNWKRDESDTEVIKDKERQRDSHNSMQAEMNNAMMMAMPDGVVSANGIPMAVAASSVTPIHDGAVAQTDPQDHAIFAKVGGPFDNLFKGILPKVEHTDAVVNSIVKEVEAATTYNNSRNEFNNSRSNTPYSIVTYNAVDNGVSNSNLVKSSKSNVYGGTTRNESMTAIASHGISAPQSATYSSIANRYNGDTNIQSSQQTAMGETISVAVPQATAIQDNAVAQVEAVPMKYPTYIKEEAQEKQSPMSQPTTNSLVTQNTESITVEPIKISLDVNVNGGGEHSFEFAALLQNDPNLIRTLSQLISQELQKKVNGGRLSNPLTIR